MNGKQLAEGLGLSAAMVSKLRKRGMPTSSLEAAQKWRKRHLIQTMVKGVRFDARDVQAAPIARALVAPSSPAVASIDARPFLADFPDSADSTACEAFVAGLAVMRCDEALHLIGTLGRYGAQLLADGTFDQIEPDLRAALRSIPRAQRATIGIRLRDDDPRASKFSEAPTTPAVLPAEVWEELLRPLLDAMKADRADACTKGAEPQAESDAADDDWLTTMYSVAAGELRVVSEKGRDASI